MVAGPQRDRPRRRPREPLAAAKDGLFPEQFGREAQSGQAISTLPSAPTSTLGNGAARTADELKRDGAIVVSGENVAPPSVERTAAIPSS